MDLETLGLPFLLALIFLLASLAGYSRIPRALKVLIIVGLLLRVVGAVARQTVLTSFYGGVGDASGYYGKGLKYANQFWNLDFSPLYDSSSWWGGIWWGTQFVYFPSAVVMSVIGPTMVGGFIAFSLLSFAGLVGFAVAFRRCYPDVPLARYARWIWLFPALWFWPSSIGKEALVMMGLGLAVAGFAGRHGRINWFLLTVGIFFVFAVRPQVAAVVIASMLFAQWFSLGGRWTLGRTVQSILLLGVGVGGIWLSLRFIGVDGFDTEGVQSYLADQTANSTTGSTVGTVGVSLTGIPIGLVNILLRPFPWEASNPMVLFSALETMLLWGILWHRRRNVTQVLRNWRSDRLVRLAIPFILLYASLLGMLMVNLGIIARQRIFLFPFIFLLVEAAPRAVAARAAARVPASRQPLREVIRPSARMEGV